MSLVVCVKRLCRISIVVFLCLFAANSTFIARATDTPENPGELPVEVGMFEAISFGSSDGASACAATAGVRWLPGSTVSISFVRDEFTKSERSGLREAVERWQRALSGTKITIVLVMGADIDANTTPATSQIIVRRDHTMEQNRYGRIVASVRPDNYLDSASILVNGSIQKKQTLRKILLHEIGHALGLRDCSSCGSGKSVMNHFSRKSILAFSIRESAIPDEPSPSDISQVENGYRQAAPVRTQRATVEWKARQTIIADESVLVTETNNVAATESILAPYLGARPNSNSRIRITGNERVLTVEEKTHFEAQLPALLQAEATTMDELKNYTFKRDVRIQTIDNKGRVTGEYRRISDMLLDDHGRRIERNLKLTKPTLKGLEVTTSYIEDFSGAQLKGFELNQRDQYRFEPFGVDMVDARETRVYRISPVTLATGTGTQARVFYGFIWVEEKTGKILKIAGCALPDDKQRYPLFETQRALVDEKYLFPVTTVADDYLMFPSRKVHVRMLITYTDYKRFASRVSITEIDDVMP